MENASKALIIAGAILIAILLISLGVMMFNASKGTTAQAKDTSEVLESGAKTGVLSLKKQLGTATIQEFFPADVYMLGTEWFDLVRAWNETGNIPKITRVQPYVTRCGGWPKPKGTTKPLEDLRSRLASDSFKLYRSDTNPSKYPSFYLHKLGKGRTCVLRITDYVYE